MSSAIRPCCVDSTNVVQEGWSLPWRSQHSREAEKMVGRKAVNAENDRTRISQRMSSFAMAPTEVVYVEFEG